MARRIVHQLVDDIDGTELETGDGETVMFSLDGVAYEIDLTDDNARALRDALSHYIDHARRVSGGGRSGVSASRAPRSTGSDRDLPAVRAWAKANGHTVSERGRVAASVLEAYDAAH